MDDKISVDLPRELVEVSGLPPSKLEPKNLLIWVLELCSEGKDSFSKSAELHAEKL